ncbi:hypothetical protein PAPHI01_2639 [Pancytospora philotis]|nr:hypothetical protein PAPHI01_2639 [Pancytospora philotis]
MKTVVHSLMRSKKLCSTNVTSPFIRPHARSRVNKPGKYAEQYFLSPVRDRYHNDPPFAGLLNSAEHPSAVHPVPAIELAAPELRFVHLDDHVRPADLSKPVVVARDCDARDFLQEAVHCFAFHLSQIADRIRGCTLLLLPGAGAVVAFIATY